MAPTEEINVANPDYKEMSSGRSGHIEAFHMKYKPSKVSYESLVRHFFTFHDPTTKGQQGEDKGPQYQSAIWYHTNEQKEIIYKVKNELQDLVNDQSVTCFKTPFVCTEVL